jgi:ABC-2 type transport system ATP-binding protein
MTRRIGIAQALVNDPDFLILDEPTSGLDPIGTRQVKDLLLELRRRGKTILLSSHLLSDVEDVCDRMVMLYGGRVRAQGTADELLCDTNRTVIHCDRLSDATIAHIEQIIQADEGKSIDRVEAPRQRLESLFLDLVEAARREQAETSGALHGGTTAAFLRAEPEEGESVIDALLKEETEPIHRAARVEPAEPVAHEEEEDVLAELLHEEKAPAPTRRGADAAPAGAPEAPRDVDDSVIDSLHGGDDDPERPAK